MITRLSIRFVGAGTWQCSENVTLFRKYDTLFGKWKCHDLASTTVTCHLANKEKCFFSQIFKYDPLFTTIFRRLKKAVSAVSLPPIFPHSMSLFLFSQKRHQKISYLKLTTKAAGFCLFSGTLKYYLTKMENHWMLWKKKMSPIHHKREVGKMTKKEFTG